MAGDKKPYCRELNELLYVPLSFKLVSIISLGYPESEKVFNIADKRSIKEVIHWEKF